MKRIMLAGLALAAAAPATAAERRYTVTDFDRVQVDGPFVVTLSTGKAGSAVATGDQQAIDRVSIEVQGRLLKVRPNRSAWSGFPGEEGGPLAIALTTHGLRGASVIGSGSLAIDKEPIVQPGRAADLLNYTDPIPQSLVLTAIVIGFATTALFLVVLLALRGLTDSDHVDGEEEPP